jgi:hypothetical protein
LDKLYPVFTIRISSSEILSRYIIKFCLIHFNALYQLVCLEPIPESVCRKMRARVVGDGQHYQGCSNNQDFFFQAVFGVSSRELAKRT